MSYATRFRAALPAEVDAPTFPTAALVPRAARARLAEACETVYAALETVGRVMRDSHELDEFLGLSDEAVTLMRGRSTFDAIQVFTRFDVVGDLQGDFAIVEANTSDPSGIGYVDAMTHAHLTAGSDLAFDDLAGSHLRSVKTLTGVEFGCLAIATDRDSPIRNDLLCLANRYRGIGIDARVVDTRELTVEGNAIFLGDTRVAALHRDLLDEYVAAPFWPAVAPLTRALARGVIPVVNPFAASLVDSKAIFEIFTSDLGRRYFGLDTLVALRKVIPWTRRFGRDLAAHALSDREAFVLKPARAYGGTGVCVGRASTSDAWTHAVDTALADGGYVLQAAAPVSQSNGLDVVYGAWVHRGSFAGTFARVGHGAVLNVHRGGALLPVGYVSEYAETRAAG